MVAFFYSFIDFVLGIHFYTFLPISECHDITSNNSIQYTIYHIDIHFRRISSEFLFSFDTIIIFMLSMLVPYIMIIQLYIVT